MPVELVDRPCLGREVIELHAVGEAVGVVGEEPATLLPVSLHRRVGIAQSAVDIQLAQLIGGLPPGYEATRLRLVVVPEAIPPLHDAVGVIEVDLALGGVTAEVALGELVHVIDEVRPEEIPDDGEVLRAVVSVAEAAVELQLLERLPSHRTGPGELPLIGVPILYHVQSTAACGQCLTCGIAHGRHIPPIDSIHTVPVDIARIGIAMPELGIACGGLGVLAPWGRHAREVGGEVAVVVGAGVGGVVPVERAVAVVAEAVAHRGRDLQAALQVVEVVAELHDRLVAVSDAGIAPRSCLTADVGVVEVGARQIVGLLGGGAGYPASGGSAEGHEADVVRLVQALLYAEEVAPRVVELSSYIAVLPVPRAAHDAGQERPAALILPRGPGEGEAIGIGAVAIGVGQAALGPELRGAYRYIVRDAYAAYARDDGLEGLGGLLLAGHIVEPAPQRPSGVAAVEVVHLHTIEHLAAVGAVVAAGSEARRAEDVAGGREEGVTRGGQQGDAVAAAEGIVAILTDQELVVALRRGG